MNNKNSEKATIFWAAVGALLIVLSLFASEPRRANGKIKLVIDFGNGQIRSFEAPPDGESTVWDFLQQVSGEYQIPLEAAKGFSPEVIGELENGENGKNWVWYKNGKRQAVSPIKEELSAGETILFKFE